MKNNTNIAIYGGSFNPPTLAHESIAEQILTKTSVKKIIINPSGERDDKDFGIDFQHREALIDVYIQSLQSKGLDIELDDYFFRGKNTGKTTSYKEGHYFEKRLGKMPGFIFGSDVIPSMPEWSGNKDRYIEKVLKKLFIHRVGYDKNPDYYGITNYQILENIYVDNISSSMVRERLKNKYLISCLVHSDIERYIHQQNLYL